MEYSVCHESVFLVETAVYLTALPIYRRGGGLLTIALLSASLVFFTKKTEHFQVRA